MHGYYNQFTSAPGRHHISKVGCNPRTSGERMEVNIGAVGTPNDDES